MAKSSWINNIRTQIAQIWLKTNRGGAAGLRLWFFSKYLEFTKEIPIFAAENKIVSFMEKTNFNKYSDAEFKDALRATLNLKKEWMESVNKREKELGLQWDFP